MHVNYFNFFILILWILSYSYHSTWMVSYIKNNEQKKVPQALFRRSLIKMSVRCCTNARAGTRAYVKEREFARQIKARELIKIKHTVISNIRIVKVVTTVHISVVLCCWLLCICTNLSSNWPSDDNSRYLVIGYASLMLTCNSRMVQGERRACLVCVVVCWHVLYKKDDTKLLKYMYIIKLLDRNLLSYGCCEYYS